MPLKKPRKGLLAPCHPFCRLQHACLSVFDTAPLHVKVIQLVCAQSKCEVRLAKTIHHPALLASAGWRTAELTRRVCRAPMGFWETHFFPGVVGCQSGQTLIPVDRECFEGPEIVNLPNC